MQTVRWKPRNGSRPCSAGENKGDLREEESIWAPAQDCGGLAHLEQGKVFGPWPGRLLQEAVPGRLDQVKSGAAGEWGDRARLPALSRAWRAPAG